MYSGQRWGHIGLGWALNPTLVSVEEEERTHRHRVEQMGMKADIGGAGARSQESQGLSTASSFSEARTRGTEQILPLSLQQEPILPTPWFCTSGLQSYERIYSCCFKPEVCCGSPETNTVTDLQRWPNMYQALYFSAIQPSRMELLPCFHRWERLTPKEIKNLSSTELGTWNWQIWFGVYEVVLDCWCSSVTDVLLISFPEGLLSYRNSFRRSTSAPNLYLFCSQMYPKCTEQLLAQKSCLTNICWMNESFPKSHV